MDEAWVGIAGVAGTLVGTLGASWFGFRQTRLQAREARAEAERQRRFESVKDRREPRAKTYADFLGTAHTVKEHLDRHEEMYDSWSASESLVLGLNKARAEVIIAGPPAVAEAAGDIIKAFLRIGGRFRPDLPPVDVDIENRMEKFAEAAAAALEDYGADAPRRPSGAA